MNEQGMEYAISQLIGALRAKLIDILITEGQETWKARKNAEEAIEEWVKEEDGRDALGCLLALR